LRAVQTIIDAWEITPKDSLLHCLPLNHVHGLIYCLLTYLYAGAKVDMLPKFNPEQVWDKLLNKSNNINSFMAVPTIYVQLVNAMMNDKKIRDKYSSEHMKWIFNNKMRIVVSGSAPLNVKTSLEWNELTGYNILERYGMTEIGLGLSNPYREIKELRRLAGAVGRPYGNGQVRIVEPSEDNMDEKRVLVVSDNKTDQFYNGAEEKRIFGELQVKSDMVFREYLNKPEQTKETFTNDGWFKTGKFFHEFFVFK
jgi:malonyl-CoA/methylmalonyl-CoA synthetase